MGTEQRGSAGQTGLRYGGDVRISEDEWVKDPKTGEMRLSEKGITRQKEDITALTERLGGEVAKWYPENDTSAYKKRRIRLPNGRSVWRVYRPEFRRMLADYEDGNIDGIIFYDIDRLARQPRDLEDLIDLVEYYKRPVETVTGNIDLRTSNGRAMARVLVAMANKSSEDTARRVARAKLQIAQEGNGSRFTGSRRRFGYREDGSLNETEAALIRDAAKRFMAGESWNGIAKHFRSSGIRPVYANIWSMTSIRQVLLSPSIAGIAVYNGSLREENKTGRPKNLYSDPEAVALKDAAGRYVMGNWKPVLSVNEWKALVAESEARRKGQTFSARGTRKYLLTGLLRCGRVHENGVVCNRSMAGFKYTNKAGTLCYGYRCPDKIKGGCGGLQRSMPKLDKLIEDLLFAHLAENAPDSAQESDRADETDPDAIQLAETQESIRKLRMGYAAVPRTVSDDTMFSVLPQLEATERDLKAKLRKKAKVRMGRVSLAKTPEEVRREWDEAADNLVRRAILSRYLKAVIIRKTDRRGPGDLDYSAIEPVWREDGEYAPLDHVIY
jgi:DNA invertase Pin-like site-specific DNA recombinase